jgi:hypothetical protein
MKKARLFAIVTMMVLGFNASAQKAQIIPDGWQSVWFQWNPSSTRSDYHYYNNMKFNGISLGYSKAFSVSKNLPLYLEAGLGVQYSYDKKTASNSLEDLSIQYSTKKFRMLSAKVPVTLAYKYDIPNIKVSVLPFIGVNFRFNALARQNTENIIMKNGEILYQERHKADCFDSDDMGKSDYTWNRFQAGWEFGVKATYDSKYMIGLSYGKDFNEIGKNTKIHTTSLTLGYIF